jgi:hypothetical protein
VGPDGGEAFVAWFEPEHHIVERVSRFFVERFAAMRWFYALPALYAIQRTAGEQCAWFQDLRFAVPGRATVPFRYGMCRAGPSAPWQRFEMVGEDGRRPI